MGYTMMNCGLLCTVLVVVAHAAPLWDTAALQCDASISSTRRRTNLPISPQCEKGKIAWTYTANIMTLQFDKPGPYRVCFFSKYEFSREKYTVGVIQGNRRQLIGAPRRGNEVCLESLGGPLRVLIMPHRTYYKTWVTYEVTCMA